MRFLHTADWHLGRSFHGAGLLSTQAAWLDWLVDVATEQQVDAILVAGDIYDRALPPVDAVRLLDDVLPRLTEVAPVILISGNHDSAPRLAFGSRLLERAGLHVRTDPADVSAPVLLGGTAIYGIPYLEPSVAAETLESGRRTHTAVLTAAMDRVRSDLITRPAGTRSVVLAHAFVTGAAESDSERNLTAGGSAGVAPAVLDGVDYVALGHLHGPQRVGDTARYAGSPVAFSFSEADHRKSVAIVDLSASGPPSVELIPCPVPRALARVRGTLDELLADPLLTDAEDAWVQATLTDPLRPMEAMEQLRRRFPHTVSLEFDPQGASPLIEGSYAARLRGLDDVGLAARFVEDVRGQEASGEEQDLLEAAFAARRVAETAA
jgi:DNA repair protein SbcD/Mre11